MNLFERLHRALGPILAGMLLDLLDLATFGPIGIYAGFIVGAIVGWWIGGLYRFPKSLKIATSILAGIYMTVPMTEFIPIATLIGGVARFLEEQENPPK